MNTLPLHASSSHQTAGGNMRMFGDVTELFSSIPTSTNTTSASTSTGGRKIQRVRSFGSADRRKRDVDEEQE